MSGHLIPYLRALAAGRHDDVSVAVDAVIEIRSLTRERDEARAAVEKLRTENARLRARISEYFREPDTHPVEDV